MSIKFVCIILIAAFITACSGQSGGLAPSKDQNQPLTPTTDISYESSIKYGEENTTVNGWEISIDTTDPIETIALGNGWTAEVKHE